MSEPTSPKPAPTSDHTEWVWDSGLGEWVDREKAPEEPEVVEIVRTPKPADTATETFESTVEVVDGIPTLVWHPRAWTAQELAERQANADREAARIEVRGIIEALQAEKARVQPVIDKTASTITGTDTKDVARAVKRTADAVIALARFVS